MFRHPTIIDEERGLAQICCESCGEHITTEDVEFIKRWKDVPTAIMLCHMCSKPSQPVQKLHWKLWWGFDPKEET